MLKRIVRGLSNPLFYIRRFRLRKSLGYVASTADISIDLTSSCYKKIYFFENTNLYGKSLFIINPAGDSGKFIMKKNSAARELTVVTGNHSVSGKAGVLIKELMARGEGNVDKDVIVDEDVWIGTNVTLLSGSMIGRGAIIGAGSVIRTSIPPYSIITGNPAKVIGFKLTPCEIIEHEKALYPKDERLPLELLEKNYEKYFLKRLKEIKEYTRL